MSEPIVTRAAPSRVTVYEDRADVSRHVVVDLPAGSALVRVEDLPAVVSDAHVTATLVPLEEGASTGTAFVNDLRVERRVIAGEDPHGARTRERKKQQEALDDEVHRAEEAAKHAQRARANAEKALRQWVDQTRRATAYGEGSLEGWRRGGAALEEALARADEARVKARAAVTEARQRRARLLEVKQAPPAPKAGPRQRTVADVKLQVASAGGRHRLTLSTLVPCAAWRPSHEARLVDPTAAGAEPRVVFSTSAAVWNRTGEAWNDVDLVFSTARPSAGAELPSLTPDKLTLRTKAPEERRTVVVEHRDEGVPKTATQGTAPGVDDGGVPRTFTASRTSVPDDGRPHTVFLTTFEVPCRAERVAYLDASPQVFLRASLKNAGAGPILAGPVTLVAHGSWVGTGDVLYVGPGESFDLSFGSDDRFVVRTRRLRLEDRKLVGRDVVHFVRESTFVQTSDAPQSVLVHLRMPVSEVKQLRVLPSPQHTTLDLGGVHAPDAHGVVRVPLLLQPRTEEKVSVGFSFDASGDVQIPDPW